MNNGQHHRPWVRVLSLIGLVCLLTASLSLTLDYRAQLVAVKKAIYTRCLQREQYDQASQDARQEQLRLYQVLVHIDRTSAVTAPGAHHIQQARIVAYQHAIVALAQPLRIGAPQGCGRFK